MWGVETDGSWFRLYNQSKYENINHENWSHKGNYILYHGHRYENFSNRLAWIASKALYKLNLISKSELRKRKNEYVEAIDWESEKLFCKKVDVPVKHAVAGQKSNSFIVDSSDGFLYYFHKNDMGEFVREKLCYHGSDYSNQSAHPHPVISSDGESVIFTSNYEGNCNVYECKI